MSNATDQARSTRDDARAFADAFAAADDAFTFGNPLGESREVSLEELGDVITLSPRAARPLPAQAPVPRGAAASGDDELLTLDELGEALARPVHEAEVLDFDFGTSAHERARRRTAARLDAAPAARRRVSGPVTSSSRGRRADVRLTEVEPPAERRAPLAVASSASGRLAMADAAASAAERLADPVGVQRFTADRTSASRLEAGSSIPVELRPSERFLADPDGRRTFEITGRPGGLGATPRLREVERRPGRASRGAADRLGPNPDRIAMWAVLLGIVLVLIAFTSG